MTAVEIALGEGVSSTDADELRKGASELSELLRAPASRARFALRREDNSRAHRRYVADASVVLDGRTIAAHAAGVTGAEAAHAVRNRLHRQLRRVVGRERDGRRKGGQNELLPLDFRHRPEAGLKPPAERRIVRRRTYLATPLGTVDALRDLLDIDAEFMLFVHARTGEDVVVYLRDDDRIGLLFPPGSTLEDERDIVVPKPSRYPGPIELRQARTEMDFLDHRFLYFIDAEDARGKVIYLRHDGDYGLVQPA
jgi:ribosome-associated translation inhibitor RaiA